MPQPKPILARNIFLAGLVSAALAGCATLPPASRQGSADEEIQILALNDFHGNLVAPTAATTWHDRNGQQEERLGGVAQLGAMLGMLRADREHTITVAAGDLIGASPLESAYFLDEPAIMALNAIGLELAAVGNHEFDRGTAELRRIQHGGCEQHTSREPCLLDRPFVGARFSYLAANVLDERDEPLFSGTAIRDFGPVRVGFIGITLKDTATLVAPAGTAGYRFADEAATANKLTQELRSAGADTVVLLIHQGGRVDPFFNADGCPALSGPIVPILDDLDPAISLVVSGHTHAAYICERPTRDGSPRLLTSAGRYGNFVTDIRLRLDAPTGRVIEVDAVNLPVREVGGRQADVASLVERYVEASTPVAARVIGRIEGALEPRRGDTDYALANLVADAQLAQTAGTDAGGAEIAFINTGGLRGQLVPAADGSVTYGQLFALQPFGNTLVTLELTGDQIRRVLEQQFTDDRPANLRQSLLVPSAGLQISYDRNSPVGSRITAITLDGSPLDPAVAYVVTVNNFLASGGDGFSILAEGKMVVDGGLDLDALEAFIENGVQVPPLGRIVDVTSPAETY